MIIAMMPARNEAWVLRYTARAVLQWVDHLVMMDHASTDNTPRIMAEIAAENPGKVTWFSETDPIWREMAYRQRMLKTCRTHGARWIVQIDADEVLTATIDREAIRKQIRRLRPGRMLLVPWLDNWRGLDVYWKDETPGGKRGGMLAFGDAPFVGWNIKEQFHHRIPAGMLDSKSTATRWPSDESLGGVMHLQRASWRRAQARQAWYKVIEVLRWPERLPRAVLDARYSRRSDETNIVLKKVPQAWWAHGLDRNMIDVDATPWQEDDVRRLVAEHGRAKFAGLNLFGIVEEMC